MLANSMRPSALTKYINDDVYTFEPKLDGHRILAVVQDGRVECLNRRGESYSHNVPHCVTQSVGAIPGHWVLDGELIGRKLHCFDVLVALGEPVTDLPQAARRKLLVELLGRVGDETLRLCPAAATNDAKLELVRFIIERGGEGVMVKHGGAIYQPGRRSSYILKAKFAKDVDVVVLAVGVNGKDNLALGLYDQNGRMVEVGRCTALAGDGPRVTKGMVVTCTYLYAVDPKRPRLVQPTRPLIRTDKKPEECLLSQLHYTSRDLQL